MAVSVVDLSDRRPWDAWTAVIVSVAPDDRLIVRRDSNGRDYRVGASFVTPRRSADTGE